MSDIKPIDTSEIHPSTKYGIVLKKLNDAEDALAASQRRIESLELQLANAKEGGRIMVEAADRHFATALANHKECVQLQARLDAAAEAWKIFKESMFMSDTSCDIPMDKLDRALSPTDPPAGETK